MRRSAASSPWVMGMANMTWGFYGAVTLITVPQLLASEHVPEPTIAAITAAAMIPTFCAFLLAPILDVRFSRRSYAIGFGLLAGGLGGTALAMVGRPAMLTPLLVAGYLAATLQYSALGGWLSAVVAPGDEGRLAASFTIANIGGFGVAALLFITLMRAFPGIGGAAAVGLVIALPMLLFLLIPATAAGDDGARESFARLARDLSRLVRQGAVRRALLFFMLPVASFALTNTLGGLGNDFGASERFVALVVGLGVTAAGVAGSLIVPPLVARIAPRLLYLAIGGGGALFTLSLIALPRTPAVFAVALIGENILQSAAFVVESTIIFRSIGEHNPLAATQFALLQAATCLPIAYMQAIDGQAYGRGGLAGTFATDAGLALIGCVVLLPLALYWHRRERAADAVALQPA